MQKVYSVGQINTYIRNMFTQDFVLNRVSVRGEISNLKYHTSGHIYFTLKDASAAIACVMFAGARGGLAFRMSNGQQVVVDGAVNVYERDGKYQLYATKIRQDGAGELYEKFLELKEELEEMGMFAPEYKQPIPARGRHGSDRSGDPRYHQHSDAEESGYPDHPLPGEGAGGGCSRKCGGRTGCPRCTWS